MLPSDMFNHCRQAASLVIFIKENNFFFTAYFAFHFLRSKITAPFYCLNSSAREFSPHNNLEKKEDDLGVM